MPSKDSRFTLTQDKKARKIALGYIKKGMSKKRAMSIGYATVQSHKKSKKKKSNFKF